MVRVRMPVRRGVTVGRAIAAPDVAARHAQPQVIPPSANALAVLAALTRGHDVDDKVEMAARGCHGPAPFASWEMLLPRMGHFQPAPPAQGIRRGPEDPIRDECRTRAPNVADDRVEPAQIGIDVLVKRTALRCSGRRAVRIVDSS